MDSNDEDGAPIFVDISTKKHMIMNMDVRIQIRQVKGNNIEKSFLFLTDKRPMDQRIKN